MQYHKTSTVIGQLYHGGESGLTQKGETRNEYRENWLRIVWCQQS